MNLYEIAMANAPGVAWNDVAIISATGQTIGAQTATLPRLRIGGLQFPAWAVAFADLHTFKLWNLLDRPALLLGVDALSRFEAVSLDFARDEVRFRLPKAPPRTAERPSDTIENVMARLAIGRGPNDKGVSNNVRVRPLSSARFGSSPEPDLPIHSRFDPQVIVTSV